MSDTGVGWAIKLEGDRWAETAYTAHSPYWQRRHIFFNRDAAMDSARRWRKQGYSAQLIRVTRHGNKYLGNAILATERLKGYNAAVAQILTMLGGLRK
jgi:hypothetical protein